MAVIINELEQVPPPDSRLDRGGASEPASGAGGSATVDRTQVLTVIRRAAARRARLWAD